MILRATQNGAAPKVRRIVDDTAKQRARLRDGACLYGLFRKDGRCVEGIDPHHIQTVGSGGDDTLENLICLCRYHHQLAQTYVIEPRELRELLTLYYDYLYQEA